jgi:hypothetical protein
MDGCTRKLDDNISKYRENSIYDTNTKIRVFDNVIAVIVCLENIQSNVNRSKRRMGMISTNIFERQSVINENNNEHNERWLMIHHHGSHVSNYIPPNVSV